MKNWDNEWLYFSRRARRGAFVLLFIFILVAVTPRLYYAFISPPEKFHLLKVPIKIPEEIDGTQMTDKTEATKGILQKKERYTVPTESFDPNTYPKEAWMAIGLSEKQANTILNYLQKGGKLRVKEDLSKLFVINEELYELLLPKIALPSANEQSDERGSELAEATVETAEEFILISINTATEEELQQINGIGPFFASQIIKRRDEYGGLLNIKQLQGIYKLDDERLAALEPHLHFDSKEIRKLNLNSASYDELRKHPLIDYEMARSIVQYREEKGEFTSVDELLYSQFIDMEMLKRLIPYVKVE